MDKETAGRRTSADNRPDACNSGREGWWECFWAGTFAGLVMDADGLRLVVAVVVLDTHQVGVGAVVETRPHGQHVFVGLVHGLHQLQETNNMCVRLKTPFELEVRGWVGGTLRKKWAQPRLSG